MFQVPPSHLSRHGQENMSSHHIAGLRAARVLLKQLREDHGIDPAMLRPDNRDYARGAADALQQFDRRLRERIDALNAKILGRPTDAPVDTWPA